MLILISYDVVDDRRRTKLAHTLKDFGQRVQYSVFECSLDGKALERLETRISGLIEPEEDSVRIYRLCADCRGKIAIWGQGEVSEDPEVYVF